MSFVEPGADARHKYGLSRDESLFILSKAEQSKPFLVLFKEKPFEKFFKSENLTLSKPSAKKGFWTGTNTYVWKGPLRVMIPLILLRSFRLINVFREGLSWIVIFPGFEEVPPIDSKSDICILESF